MKASLKLQVFCIYSVDLEWHEDDLRLLYVENQLSYSCLFRVEKNLKFLPVKDMEI